MLQTEVYLYDHKLQSQTFIVQALADFTSVPIVNKKCFKKIIALVSIRFFFVTYTKN